MLPYVVSKLIQRASYLPELTHKDGDGVGGRELLSVEPLVCVQCFKHLISSSPSFCKFGITNSYGSSQRNFREAFSFSYFFQKVIMEKLNT